MELFINNIISLLIGILSSIFAWWILFKKIVPKIKFSEKISKIRCEPNSNNFEYRIKYHNIGKRKIIDVNIIVRLEILGLYNNRKKTWKIIYIESENEMKFKPILIPQKNGGNLIRFDLNNTDLFSDSIMPKEIIDKFKAKILSLEDVFKIGKNRNLEVILMGYDEFSGARKVLKSKNYTINDIAEGPFEDLSLKIAIV